MIIDHLNLNALRVFECVFRHQSMTAAAKELKLTQSGVSQHIRQLEEILETKLFERVKQKIIPTFAAKKLYNQSSLGLFQIENALGSLKASDSFFKGTFTIGFPAEFGNSVILGIMREVFVKYPKLKFHFIYGYASEMNRMLLNGEVDIAFIDQYTMDSEIASKPVYEEYLHLCVAKKYKNIVDDETLKVDDFRDLDFISYFPDCNLIKTWFQFHFPGSKIDLYARATAMNVQGVARLIKKGTGVGILPHHYIKYARRNHDGLQVIFEHRKPLTNVVHLAYLQTREEEPIVKSLTNTFLEILKERY